MGNEDYDKAYLKAVLLVRENKKKQNSHTNIILQIWVAMMAYANGNALPGKQLKYNANYGGCVYLLQWHTNI